MTARGLGNEQLAETGLTQYQQRAKTRFPKSCKKTPDWAASRPADPGIAVELSRERIRELDAEHIFLSVYPDVAGNANKYVAAFQSNRLWGQLHGQLHEVNDETWMTAVAYPTANAILDDLATTFTVTPAR